MGMSSLSSSLVAASATIIFSLGMIHLLYTFRGTKLHPRDRDLQTRLREVSPFITRETTMWRAWIGFTVLGWLYWFRIPFRGIVLATALYVVALIVR
jgi:hypothetical protein